MLIVKTVFLVWSNYILNPYIFESTDTKPWKTFGSDIVFDRIEMTKILMWFFL